MNLLDGDKREYPNNDYDLNLIKHPFCYRCSHVNNWIEKDLLHPFPFDKVVICYGDFGYCLGKYDRESKRWVKDETSEEIYIICWTSLPCLPEKGLYESDG